MKQILSILLLGFSFCASAQNNSFVKYFDSTWQPSTKENASFSAHFEKLDSFYRCHTYYQPSNKLKGKSTYYDTLFKKPAGLIVRYYEEGTVSDSTFYDNQSRFVWEKYYLPDGKLKSEFHASEPAEFPGGQKGWVTFLQQNLKANTPTDKKAPAGKYTVYLNFLINEDGSISDIQAENDPGYGTKAEAIRVISKSPKWKPAVDIETRKVIKHKQRQSISFLVSDK